MVVMQIDGKQTKNESFNKGNKLLISCYIYNVLIVIQF